MKLLFSDVYDYKILTWREKKFYCTEFSYVFVWRIDRFNFIESSSNFWWIDLMSNSDIISFLWDAIFERILFLNWLEILNRR
jgi:hypothetical protein